MDRYDYLLIKSKEIWEESIAGGGYVKKKDKDNGDTSSFKAGAVNNASQS